jgi:uncharacterized protein YceK
MKSIILTLIAMLTGCASVICENGTVYNRQGMTYVYVPTTMKCIEKKESL